MAADVDGDIEGLLDAFGDGRGFIAGGQVLADDDEFVAAEPGRGVGIPQATAQPPRDVDQQFIAGVVTRANR